MNKFIWKDEYSVGIPSIDEQHKHFFGITNEIIDLLAKEDETREDLLAATGELGDYAFYHLSTEEGYFDKLAYPDAAIHVKAHNMFRDKTVHFLEQVRAADADAKQLAEEIASYSIYWLSEHILLLDHKYTVFFKEHGVQ